jgi:membrane protein YdbS with pleckstrin-like domain
VGENPALPGACPARREPAAPRHGAVLERNPHHSPLTPGGNMQRWLRIGLLLIVAWFVLKIVFNIAGFIIHLLVIAGIIFVLYSVVNYFLGQRQRR